MSPPQLKIPGSQRIDFSVQPSLEVAGAAIPATRGQVVACVNGAKSGVAQTVTWNRCSHDCCSGRCNRNRWDIRRPVASFDGASCATDFASGQSCLPDPGPQPFQIADNCLTFMIIAIRQFRKHLAHRSLLRWGTASVWRVRVSTPGGGLPAFCNTRNPPLGQGNFASLETARPCSAWRPLPFGRTRPHPCHCGGRRLSTGIADVRLASVHCKLSPRFSAQPDVCQSGRFWMDPIR